VNEDHAGKSSGTITQNVVWGLRWSLKFVVAYSLIAGSVFIFSGPSDGPLSFPQILLMYLGLGVVAGIVIGLLRPLFRTRMGATVAGMIVGAAVYIGGGISVAGIQVMHEPGPVIALLLAALLVGGLSGSKWWKQTSNNGDRDV
jgi:hypothetical protein